MFVANLLIALREGFEAALVVGILVAYLVKVGRRDLLPALWAGVALAVLAPLALGVLLTWGPQTLTFQAQEIIGGTLSLVAAAMVIGMVLWMGRNARSLKSGLEGSLGRTIASDRAARGVVGVAVLAVGREGMETALFLWATVRSSVETSTALTTAGMLTGFALAILLGWMVYRGSRRLDMRRFFALTGFFLILVAAGVAAYGVGDLQEAGVLPGAQTIAWDLSGLVAATGAVGTWIHTLAQAVLQVNLTPTVLQVLTWIAVAGVVTVLYARQLRATTRPAPAGSAPRTAPASVQPTTAR